MTTNSFTMSHVHLFSPQLIQTARVAFFRNVFLGGRGDQSHSRERSRFHLQADTPLGARRPIPDYQRLHRYRQSHHRTAKHISERLSGLLFPRLDSRRTQSEIRRAKSIASRSMFCLGSLLTASLSSRLFLSTIPSLVFCWANPFSSFRAGAISTAVCANGLSAGYAQDEWRVSQRLTLTYGLRYEVNTPYTDIRNRLNAWAAGQAIDREPGRTRRPAFSW